MSRRTVPLPFELSEDVLDKKELRGFLSDTTIFEVKQEGVDYLEWSLERFRITMSLIPPLDREARVLELGSNPYFITRLLRRRGLEVTCANFFGDGFHGRSEQTSRRSDGEVEVFSFDHFNVETGRFPYPDGSFDWVLCCEILEHLPHDPVQMLAEIHRVIRKPEGKLLLTTPNAVRSESLVKALKGENFYEELSGYGAYGRHNREYTLDELQLLLPELGYETSSAFTADIHPEWPRIATPRRAERTNRGENIFIVARPFGAPRWRYPRWLFMSQHAFKRIVMPELIMGHNDEIQSSDFHALETLHDQFVRWTGPSSAEIVLENGKSARTCLVIDGISPPPQAGQSIRLIAEIADHETAWDIACDGKRFSVSETFQLAEGRVEVLLKTDRVWQPMELGINDDRRFLGVFIHRAKLAPIND